MRFLKLEAATSPEKSKNTFWKWDSFDTDLASAVMQISNGDLKQELIMTQEALSKENILLPGRVSFSYYFSVTSWIVDKLFTLISVVSCNWSTREILNSI
jgi:hypothetical protein